MLNEVPAVVVAQEDGTVVAQNTPACRLMGAGRGRPCWEVVGGLENARGLPCAYGCVRELIARGPERSQHTRLRLGDRRHHLSCIPHRDLVVCSLTQGTGSSPQSWQLLTARERDVLRLLAEGETTASMAARLGLSAATVRTHVEHMRTKLDVNTRAALVALGFRLGFLD